MKNSYIIAIVVFLALAAGGTYYFVSRNKKTKENGDGSPKYTGEWSHDEAVSFFMNDTRIRITPSDSAEWKGYTFDFVPSANPAGWPSVKISRGGKSITVPGAYQGLIEL